MNIFFKRAIHYPLLLLVLSCNTPDSKENTNISIKTTLGDIKIKLYDGTPIHRDNFIRLIKTSLYDGVSFHRVIKNFMIQTGDPATKTGPGLNLPDTINTYTLPAEFNIQYFHKRGALAAARQGNDINPEMRSSGTQFYIVEGVIYNDEELIMVENQINSNIKQALFNTLIRETTDSVQLSGKTISDGEIQEIASVKMFEYLSKHKDYKIPEEQRNVYKSAGGTPLLDDTYTVFGEVIEGMDVVDRIASCNTDNYDRPVNEIKIITIKIIRN